ncbi:hypothetical protein J7E95_37380 [Streptomyces sp. ISL-14]|nr:hypothetical protein [Streptomyces sp. ISL-14]
MCHGKRGTIHQAYRDGVEDQLGSLRLSPLKHRNLNLLGRYSFTASTPAAGALRPLSDADALELDEDDEGADRTPTSGDAGVSGGRLLGNRKRR